MEQIQLAVYLHKPECASWGSQQMNFSGPVGLSNAVKNSFVGSRQLDHLAYGNTQNTFLSCMVTGHTAFVCVSIVPFFFYYLSH